LSFAKAERARHNCLCRVGIRIRSVARVCPKGKASAARWGREKFPSGNLLVTESLPNHCPLDELCGVKTILSFIWGRAIIPM